jgi:diguanylate cyclase (GGDEF)-like protein
MAITDGLTELITHKYFMYTLEKEIARSERYKKVFSLIMFDIDHFKNVNDNYGHQAGDEILKNIGKIVKKNLRLADIVARYGGEEFTVILPETAIKDALIAAEKLRKAVEKTELPYNNELLKITISLGVAAFPDIAKDAETLIKAADDALYLSKEGGRNKVTEAS